MIYTLENIQKLYQKYEGTQIGINCETQEEADEFIMHCHNMGFVWNAHRNLVNAQGLPDTYWDDKKSQTVYTYYNGFLCHGRRKLYENKGVKIIEFKNIALEIENFSDTSMIDGVPIVKLEDVNNQASQGSDVSTVKQPETLQANNPETKFCSNCGKQIKFTAKFCIHCGEKQEELTIETKPAEVVSIKEEPSVVSKLPPVETQPKTVVASHEEVNHTHQDIQTPIAKQPINIIPETETVNETAKKNHSFNVLNILQLGVNEEFKIKSNVSDKTYRFNSNGYREYKMAENIWFTSNNEQEIVYLINNPDCIERVISK